jgi:uncharacterized membrane protein YdbT with pleckstrin-like domain
MADEHTLNRGIVKAAADPGPPPALVRGATSVIPQKLITDGEVVILALKPSLWFILLVSGRWLIAAAVAIIAVRVINPWIGPRVAGTIVQGAIVVAAVRLLIGATEWLGRAYVLTDRRVMRLKGVIHIDLFECQLSRIQQVVLALPVAERVLFCGTVLFYTAGTGTVDAAWETLARPASVYQRVLEAVEKYTRQNP